MTTGAELITEERRRQIDAEGWTTQHDDEWHGSGELVQAAVGYLDVYPDNSDGTEKRHRFVVETRYEGGFDFDDPWPKEWDLEHDKRDKHPPLRRLVIAGALIAAEIDRLQRESDTP